MGQKHPIDKIIPYGIITKLKGVYMRIDKTETKKMRLTKKQKEQIIKDFNDFIRDFLKGNFEDLLYNTNDFIDSLEFTCKYENCVDIIRSLLPLLEYQWHFDNKKAMINLSGIEHNAIE